MVRPLADRPSGRRKLVAGSWYTAWWLSELPDFEAWVSAQADLNQEELEALRSYRVRLEDFQQVKSSNTATFVQSLALIRAAILTGAGR